MKLLFKSLTVTKSTSHFGRNALDMLRALQELHNLGIDVYFELENLWLHENQIQLILAIYTPVLKRRVKARAVTSSGVSGRDSNLEHRGMQILLAMVIRV